MKVIVVAGARPNFMKVAPVLRALTARGHEPVFVHTGQHYDDAMSAVFLRELAMPAPDFHLGVGSASHAVQTARVMEAFDPLLEQVRPDWTVVVGDVNSTLAVSLVVAKRRHELRTRLAHVEAGLRSNDWAMPEEVNRVVTDRVSDLLLLPSRDVEPNLRDEGLWGARCVFVGNVMIDSLLEALGRARELHGAGAPGGPSRILATLHRPSNVDDPARLAAILGALAALATTHEVLLPLHPRTRTRVEAFGLTGVLENVRVTAPLSYLEMIAAVDASAAVVTDSGGLQEETTVLGVPCVTVRAQTERPITVEVGTNRMVPWPPTRDGLLASVTAALAVGRQPVGARSPEGWDGRAAERIVEALEHAPALA